jgi:hypothetical protein
MSYHLHVLSGLGYPCEAIHAQKMAPDKHRQELWRIIRPAAVRRVEEAMFGDWYKAGSRVPAVLAVVGAVLLLIGMSLQVAAPVALASGHPASIGDSPVIRRAKALKAPTDFPVVDPGYIYHELYTLVTRFPRREAGYDTNLPPNINGHDEFAAAWAQEMEQDLAGFGPEVRHDSFPISGWRGRPAETGAFNVEVTVPGVTNPAQMVVIGCHYDGEADSTQSANDDGSGCAIELGVAKALATYWRAHQLYPARTLRFVIFDAEEQGVYGSFHYLNSTINGDSNNVVAMFNEEQSGIAYPLRYLGKTSNPLLPFYAFLTPLGNSQLYPAQSQLSAAKRADITQFRNLMDGAVGPVFTAFQALGYQSLIYQGAGGAPVSQPVFSADQTSNIQLLDDSIGSSDQIAFTLAGLPDATFVGNATYYDRNPPPWSYPYDQRQDTIQLMNVFASGSTQQSQALTLALALPGMMTTWMLNQPSIVGSVEWDHLPIAAISDIGAAIPGRPLALDAHASYDPGAGGTLGYAWNFGDGASATGVSVTHAYKDPGTYLLTLKVTSSSGGARAIKKTIVVGSSPPTYTNPYANFPQNGVPPSNPAVQLPPLNSAPATPRTTSSNQLNRGIAVMAIILIVIGLILLLVLVIVAVTVWRAWRPAS